MGLDLSVCKIERVKEIPFEVIYTQVDDEKLAGFIQENDDMLHKEIEYLINEGFYQDDFLEKMKERMTQKYNRYKENAIRLNTLYNQLTEEEKRSIARLESKEVKYYGKNWDLFGLLNHELCGDVFDHDTQSPTDSLQKDVLNEVFKKTQKENPTNEGLASLQSLLSKGEFDKYHYYIEAWY